MATWNFSRHRCQVSLENAYTITTVALTFPAVADYRYTVDFSSDGSS